MNYAIKIQIGIAILGVVEAWLEEVVILLKNPLLSNYNILNKQEHTRSAFYWGAQVLLYMILGWDQVHYACMLVIVLIINRRVFFEHSLKLFRKGKKIQSIEGDQFLDRLSQRIFGLNGGWWELFVCVSAILLINKYFLL